MIKTNQGEAIDLDQLTKRAVRSFWMDGLWEMACAGMFLFIGLWGIIYLPFVGFPSWTWYLRPALGKHVIWIGLLLLVAVLAVYFTIAWFLVKWLKRRLIAPRVGHVAHSFFLPVDSKVYTWYIILYLLGLGALYGIFVLVKGGAYATSVPLIISPAAMLWGLGKVYDILRYRWVAVAGFVLSFVLELSLTTQADYSMGPRNFLDVNPQLGNPSLACVIWFLMFLLSGVSGFISVRRTHHDG